MGHIDAALNQQDWRARYRALQHPDVQLHHIERTLHDEDSYVRAIAYYHPLTTEDQRIEYKLRWGNI